MPEAIGKWIGDDFWVVWHTPDITFQFRRAREHHRDPIELQVVAGGGPVFWDRLSPSSHRARQSAASSLNRAYAMASWATVVEVACRALTQALEAIGVPQVAEPLAPAPESWLVPHWIPRDMPTIVYGDGGAGKGFWALGLVLAALTGHPFGEWPVRACRRALWLDWEYGTSSSFQRRLWGFLETGTPPPGDRLRYLTMLQGAHEVSGAIRREITKQQIDLVVVDSLAPAAGPEPETANAAVQTLRAICSWGVTTLVIAHVPKADGENGHDAGPYGSVFNKNLARSTIRLTSEPDDEGMILTCVHRKANEGPRVKEPAGFRFLFSEGAVMVRAAEPNRSRASLSVRLVDALQIGPMTVKQLAEETAAPENQVRAELGRMRNRTVMAVIDGGAGGRGHKSKWELIKDQAQHNRTETAASEEIPPF